MFLVRIFLINLLIVTLIIWDGAENGLFCKPITRVGILPFQIYSKEKVDYLREIIASRLAGQLTKSEQITVVDLKGISDFLAEKAAKEGLTQKELDSIAKKAGVHFLVYGSLTKISKNLSLDSRVFTNLKDSHSYKNFVEGVDLDTLIENVGNKISHHILNVALQAFPAEITAAKSTALDEESKTLPTLEETPGLKSGAPDSIASMPEIDEESTIKSLPPSGSAPTTPDTYPEIAKTPIATKKELPKSKNLLSHQPINITSDKMEADNRNRTVNFSGNVVAKREDMVIFSDQLSTFYTKQGKIEKIIARGNVKINQEDRIATCQKATFFQSSQKIILTGKPKVWRGNNIITGEKITILLNEGKIDIQGSKQNRVNAIIYPMGKNLK